MSEDALARELASLQETIGLTNPLTYGSKSEWQTQTVTSEKRAKHEAAMVKSLPHTFVLTEPRQSSKAFQVAASAARTPPQPLVNENGSVNNKNKIKITSKDNDNGNDQSSFKSARSPEAEDATTLALRRRELTAAAVTAKRVPMAKRSHMDGVLHGIPIPASASAPQTTQQLSLVYSDVMQTMNRDKDTSFHRKRDTYSEYVEARARFSKMHSVN